MGLALALVARYVGAGGHSSKHCAVDVLGTGARAAGRHSPRLFLQGAHLVLQVFVGFDVALKYSCQGKFDSTQ